MNNEEKRQIIAALDALGYDVVAIAEAGSSAAVPYGTPLDQCSIMVRRKAT